MSILKARTANNIFLLLIFPGYFFYHVIRSYIAIPYVGWFSVALLLAAIFYVLKSAAGVLCRRVKKSISELYLEILFYGLILLMLVTAIINHLLDSVEYKSLAGLVWSVSNIVWLLGFYFIGKNLNPSNVTIKALWVAVLIMMLCAIYFHDPSHGVMILPLLAAGSEAADYSANYQGFARSIFYPIVILLSFSFGKSMRAFAVVIGLVALYMIGSRTEMLLFLVILPVAIYFSWNVPGVIFSILSVFILVLLALAAQPELVGRFSADSFSDASFNQRYVLLKQGLAGIINCPIFGDHLGQIRDFGSPGSYIHNILSVWRQYGLLAFLAYFTLTLSSLFIAIWSVSNGRESSHAQLLLYLSLTSFIAVIVSKSVAWPLPAFAWGLAVQLLTKAPLRAERESASNVNTAA